MIINYIQLPDEFYAQIQARWDRLEDEKWLLGKDLFELLDEFPVLGRAELLRSTVANTTCRYSSIDDYERVYRCWHNESRYDLNWSQMRACISKDINSQRDWAVRASEGKLSAEKIYRMKTGKDKWDDIQGVIDRLGIITKNNGFEENEKAHIAIATCALIDLLGGVRL